MVLFARPASPHVLPHGPEVLDALRAARHSCERAIIRNARRSAVAALLEAEAHARAQVVDAGLAPAAATTDRPVEHPAPVVRRRAASQFLQYVAPIVVSLVLFVAVVAWIG